MTRRCAVTGRTVQTGNNVSHAHNKTRRRFLPNLQMVSIYSDALAKMVRLRISMYGLRTIEHKGGLDSYLIGARDNVLSQDARKIKRRIKKAQAKTAA
jgi:large subunit ribosomal protein L28